MTAFGFVGIDPTGLVGLADTADEYSLRVDLAHRNLGQTLIRRSGRDGTLVGSHLGEVAADLGELGRGLRWRAQAIEWGQAVGDVGFGPLPVGIWLAEFAAAAVFDITAWEQSFRSWRAGRLLVRIEKMSPAEVAEAFAALPPGEAAALAHDYPEVVGSMDGAPPTLRYAANDLLIGQEVDRLRAMIAKVGGSRSTLLSSRLTAVYAEARVAEFQRWLDEDRQILLFDPTGDGRVAEVFGDLDSALHIAVIVPGMANDIGNFSEPGGGFRANAAAILGATTTPGAATVAWLGYDTPDGVDAAARDAAGRGAPDLARFLVGIDPDETRSVTVVAHSYGSVVAGVAASGGIAADNLVFVGSPGTTLESATAAKLRPGGRVWAALAAGDPIGIGVDPFGSFRWWHGLFPIVPVVGMYWTLLERDELWHGTNPVADEFGAYRITTTGSHGHSSYFEETCLENLVSILEGRYPNVSLVGS